MTTTIDKPKGKKVNTRNFVDRLGGKGYEKSKQQIDNVTFEEVDGLRKVAPLKGLDVVPNKIGQERPQSIMVKPSDLWVDGRYQRDIGVSSLNLIHSIVSDFAWHKFKPPVLTRDTKGRLIVIDGQHTAIACSMHPEIDEIPAVLVDAQGTQDQAESFIGLNTNRITVHPLDLFRASLVAGDEQNIEMKRIMDEVGISLPRTSAWIGRDEDKENKTQSVNTLKSAFIKLGPAKFTVLVEKLAACKFAPLRAEHIKAFHDIMFVYTSQRYSYDHLVSVVSALNDADVLAEAARTCRHLVCPKWRALAIVYKNYYRKAFSKLEEAA